MNGNPETKSDRKRRRGKHKLYIGTAPGAGKTFRMLEEAHQTVNIRHLESRNDLVARMTGVAVPERIPDRFLTKEESLHLETCEKLCREFEGEFLRASSY